MRVTYQAAVFKSGDVFASAGIYGAAFQIGNSVFYSGRQKNSLTGPVLFTYDPDAKANGGYWMVSLDRKTLILTAAIADEDAPGGSSSWSLTPDKCTVSNY